MASPLSLPWKKDGCPCIQAPDPQHWGLRVLSKDGETERGRGLFKASPAAASHRSPDSRLWEPRAPGLQPSAPAPQAPCRPGEGLPEASRSQPSRPSLLSSTVPVPAGSLTLFLGPQGATGGEQRGCCGCCSLRGPALQLEAEELPPE